MEKQNRFIVIVTCYNKEKWIRFNINSVKQQSYGKFLAIYGYDKSTDDTRSEIEKHISGDDRFILYDVPNQESQINNFYSCLNYLKQNNLVNDEDIIIDLDGDDWLLHPFVFSYLNEVYKNPNIWMTYGQYIEYPSGQVGGHYYMNIDDQVDQMNVYRQVAFPYSHLKTYKLWLLDKVPHEYLIDPRTGKYWSITADFAMCMPMVEMAGKSRIHRVDEPIYVYNSGNDADNESARRLNEQKETEQLIRQFKPLQKL